jgi:iron complex transport system substrate-binding protein
MASKGTVVATVLVIAILLGAGIWVMIGSSGRDDSPATITDAIGRSVTIETKPVSIVSCSPSITEMVYEFGKGDALVGVTTYCDYPEDVLLREEAGILNRS